MERGLALKLAAGIALLLPTTVGAAAGLPGDAGKAEVGVQASLPPLPMTAYGTAAGASAGQPVTALVLSGSNQTTCGSGLVTTEKGKAVYSVDVLADGQMAGCGAPGREVRLYFGPQTDGGAGWVAKESTTWTSSFRQLNVSQGTPMTNRAIIPMVAAR